LPLVLTTLLITVAKQISVPIANSGEASTFVKSFGSDRIPVLSADECQLYRLFLAVCFVPYPGNLATNDAFYGLTRFTKTSRPTYDSAWE
jgi:hypothetical protein